MNNLTLNCFFKDKNEKIPKVQSPTHELRVLLIACFLILMN